MTDKIDRFKRGKHMKQESVHFIIERRHSKQKICQLKRRKIFI